MTFLTWTLDLLVIDTPLGHWLWHQHPWMCFVLSCVPVPCYATPCLQYQHIPPSMAHFFCALWNDYKGVCEGGTPSEGVSNGSVGS